MTAAAVPTPQPAIDQSTLVVISATRNEHRSVALVLAEMARARDELDTMGIALELLVVDDSDTPETAEELISEGKLRDLQVTVIKGPGRGIGAAFVAGFEHALGSMSPTLMATMDCDGQHDATQLPMLVRAKLAGDDLLVIGSRFAEGATLTGLTRARRSCRGPATSSSAGCRTMTFLLTPRRRSASSNRSWLAASSATD